MTEKRFPIWGFGAIGSLIGGFAHIIAEWPLDVSIILTVLIGMPTWFIGLLLFGIKSDELLGVENAFAYEVPTNHNNNTETNN